jgi:hypothetical protein
MVIRDKAEFIQNIQCSPKESFGQFSMLNDQCSMELPNPALLRSGTGPALLRSGTGPALLRSGTGVQVSDTTEDDRGMQLATIIESSLHSEGHPPLATDYRLLHYASSNQGNDSLHVGQIAFLKIDNVHINSRLL